MILDRAALLAWREVLLHWRNVQLQRDQEWGDSGAYAFDSKDNGGRSQHMIEKSMREAACASLKAYDPRFTQRELVGVSVVEIQRAVTTLCMANSLPLANNEG
jgi:hypothetical protein